MPRLFLACLWISWFAHGESLPVEPPDGWGGGINYTAVHNGNDRLEFTSHYRGHWEDKVGFLATARLGTTEKRLQSLEWAVQGQYALFSFLRPTLRLHNTSRLVANTHHTGLFPHLATQAIPFDWLRLRFDLGWFLRWVSLNSAMPLPYWGGTSYYEHDLAFALGFDVVPLADWRFSLTAATFDDWDTHNFNHPLLLLTLARRFTDAEVALFFRNDYLLGFGRTQSWRFGVTLHLLQIKTD